MVQLTRPVGDWPRGAVAEVVGVGPGHVLLERVDWEIDTGRRCIAPADAITAAGLADLRRRTG